MNKLVANTHALTTEFERLSKLTKFVGIIGTLCGFCYLFAYTRDVGIPFPLGLGVLPTVLLLVGVASVVGTGVLIGGVLIPALMADDPLGVTKPYFLARDVPSQQYGLTRVKRYAFCSWLPMVIALGGILVELDVFGHNAWTRSVAIGMFAIGLIWILLTPTFVPRFKEVYWKYSFSILAQTILSVLAYCLLIILVVAVFPQAEAWPSGWTCLLVLGIFTAIHALVTIPQDKGIGRRILLPPDFSYEVASTATIAFLIAAFFVILTVFLYPVNARIGGVVLHTFGIGGGVRAIICLKNTPSAQVTNRINFGPDKCSDPLHILFDGGDTIFAAKSVRAARSKKEDPTANFEPIYFRQDEVREKIYLPLPQRK